MSYIHDFEKLEKERKRRRRIFYAASTAIILLVTCLLIWKLRSLLLPMLVGAFLAYLFRPLKDRFQVSWLPHELRVLTLFACIGFGLYMVLDNVRKHVPDERQKLELKVRVQYRLNQKFKDIVGEKHTNPVSQLIVKEAGPMMDKLNHMLDLSDDERDLFLKYSKGYKGQWIESRFFEYFQANQTTSNYVQAPDRDPTAAGTTEVQPAHGAEVKSSGHDIVEGLSIWMLAPIIFLFLGFDDGQVRRSAIRLVPNRYFELALTLLDMLDDAIGRYLRGTLLECALVGLTLTTGFILLGVPMSIALAIGVVSGFANAIPFLGTVIGLVIGLGYALIAEDITPLLPGLDPNSLPLYILILTGIAHVLDNVVYQPFVLGSAVNVHPLVVIIAIIGGSLLMGLWGMFFAIPTVVVVKTVGETLYKELRDYRLI